jgi:hypothetical protein
MKGEVTLKKKKRGERNIILINILILKIISLSSKTKLKKNDQNSFKFFYSVWILLLKSVKKSLLIFLRCSFIFINENILWFEFLN